MAGAIHPRILNACLCRKVEYGAMNSSASVTGSALIIFVPGLPTTQAGMVFFVEITNGRGEYRLGVQIASPEENPSHPVLPDLAVSVQCDDPLDVSCHKYTLPPFKFTAFGRHLLRVLHEHEEIYSRPIMVEQLPGLPEAGARP